MNTEILVQTLADTLLYLESTADEKIAPEVAATVYDIVAESLIRLEKPDKAEVARILTKLAQRTTDQQKAEFLADLPNGLGLAGGDEE
jgi:signal transduction histidine kinase